MPPESHEIDAVIANMKWLDRVVWSGVLLSGAIVVASLAGLKEFNWMNVRYQLSHAWIVFCVLTVVHIYVTILVMLAIHRLWQSSSHDDRVWVFNHVSATGGLLLRGLLPRVKRKTFGSSVLFYEMDTKGN